LTPHRKTQFTQRRRTVVGRGVHIQYVHTILDLMGRLLIFRSGRP
jgi:hypothetical protein